MRSTIGRRLLATLLIAAPLACAPATRSADPATDIASLGKPGWVRVLNDGNADFTLYFVADGVGYRLGKVARMEHARFRLPHPHPRWYSVSLVAQTAGHTPMASSPAVWEPGQNLAARMSRDYLRENFDMWVTR